MSWLILYLSVGGAIAIVISSNDDLPLVGWMFWLTAGPVFLLIAAAICVVDAVIGWSWRHLRSQR